MLLRIPKNPLLYVCLLMLPALGRAQDLIDVEIPVPRNIPRHIPFNKVLVSDQRKDKSMTLGYTKKGTPLRLMDDLQRALKVKVQRGVRDRASEGNTVLIVIKDLHFGDGYAEFKGDFYQKTGDSDYIPLNQDITLRRKYEPVLKKYNNYLGDLASMMITSMSLSLWRENQRHMVRVSPVPLRSTFPVYGIIEADTIPSPGVYSSFSDFRNEKPIPLKGKLVRNADSSFSLVTSSLDVWTSQQITSAWGLTDSTGTKYIRLVANKYLPLQRIRDTFYVHIPKGLPNMYSVVNLMEYNGHRSVFLPDSDAIEKAANMAFSPGNGETPLADLFVFAVLGTEILMIRGTVAIVRTSHKHKLKHKGIISNDYRDCALDLQTGDVIYNRPYDEVQHL